MGVFDTLSTEEATGASRYFAEGEYLCRVRRNPHFVSQQGKGNCVALETQIVETIAAFEEGRKCWINGEILGASNQPGEVCSTVLLLDRQQPALGNLKSYLLGASHLTERQIIESYAAQHELDVARPETAAKAWASFAEQCTGGGGEALKGQLVIARATRIKKKNGEPFTRVVWEVPKAEQLAKYAAAVDEAGQGASA